MSIIVLNIRLQCIVWKELLPYSFSVSSFNDGGWSLLIVRFLSRFIIIHCEKSLIKLVWSQTHHWTPDYWGRRGEFHWYLQFFRSDTIGWLRTYCSHFSINGGHMKFKNYGTRQKVLIMSLFVVIFKIFKYSPDYLFIVISTYNVFMSRHHLNMFHSSYITCLWRLIVGVSVHRVLSSASSLSNI